MVQYISKDALVAEIESKIEKYTKRGEESDAKCDGYGMYWGGVISCLNEVRTLCDTLEVKEVDLMMHTIIAEGCDWLALHTKLNHNEIEDCRNLMLTIKDEQLKTQKGERDGQSTEN
jgi:hypothetical protein